MSEEKSRVKMIAVQMVEGARQAAGDGREEVRFGPYVVSERLTGDLSIDAFRDQLLDEVRSGAPEFRWWREEESEGEECICYRASLKDEEQL